ncbi:hypothetical protein C8J57DRAFT_1573526 [Mycena rebaudengoi]|nr:hypothetical protein C8J57DRAFT_1573526 [Mycena rebaudengoi]
MPNGENHPKSPFGVNTGIPLDANFALCYNLLRAKSAPAGLKSRFSALPAAWHELTTLRFSVRKRNRPRMYGPQSFDKSSFLAKGHFKNYNTIEDFKAADKTALFNQEAEKIWDSIVATRDTADLTKFFAFPLSSQSPRALVDPRATPFPFFLVRSAVEIAPVESYASFANVPPAEQTIGFIDPSATPTSPGWPSVRSTRTPPHTSASSAGATPNSPPLRARKPRRGAARLCVRRCRARAPQRRRLGEERAGQARAADLASMMDPVRLADQAVDLTSTSCAGASCPRSASRRSR